MNKKILRQLLTIAILTSPIIALLIVAPIYIIHEDPQRSFFALWFQFCVSSFGAWMLQMFVYAAFEKRAYPRWMYGLFWVITLIIIVLSTHSLVASSYTGAFSNFEFLLLRFLLAFAMNFMIYLILDLVYTNEKRIRLMEENSTIKYNNLDNEYKLLKAQINPHFLFNALNISKSLVKTQPKDAEKYIVQLSEFLRRSLKNDQKSISLKIELENCQQYVDLQKVRFDHAFTYRVSVNEADLRKKIPFFALITLLENAIKHNAFSEEAPLAISITAEEGFVIVKNNLKSKNGVISTKVGLTNLNQRSKMLSGHEIIIDNDGANFLVKVKLMEA